MAKKPKIPARVVRVVNYCKAGEVICLTKRHSEVGDDRVYWFEPSGKPVGEWAVKRALDMGLIEPQGDGLFGDSQTYRLAQ